MVRLKLGHLANDTPGRCVFTLQDSGDDLAGDKIMQMPPHISAAILLPAANIGWQLSGKSIFVADIACWSLNAMVMSRVTKQYSGGLFIFLTYPP